MPEKRSYAEHKVEIDTADLTRNQAVILGFGEYTCFARNDDVEGVLARHVEHVYAQPIVCWATFANEAAMQTSKPEYKDGEATVPSNDTFSGFQIGVTHEGPNAKPGLVIALRLPGEWDNIEFKNLKLWPKALKKALNAHELQALT